MYSPCAQILEKNGNENKSVFSVIPGFHLDPSNESIFRAKSYFSFPTVVIMTFMSIFMSAFVQIFMTIIMSMSMSICMPMLRLELTRYCSGSRSGDRQCTTDTSSPTRLSIVTRTLEC